MSRKDLKDLFTEQLLMKVGRQYFQIIWDYISNPTWTLSFMNNVIMQFSLHQ